MWERNRRYDERDIGENTKRCAIECEREKDGDRERILKGGRSEEKMKTEEIKRRS